MGLLDNIKKEAAKSGQNKGKIFFVKDAQSQIFLSVYLLTKKITLWFLFANHPFYISSYSFCIRVIYCLFLVNGFYKKINTSLSKEKVFRLFFTLFLTY